MTERDWLPTVEAIIDRLVGSVVEQLERNAGSLKAVENYFFLALAVQLGKN